MPRNKYANNNESNDNDIHTDTYPACGTRGYIFPALWRRERDPVYNKVAIIAPKIMQKKGIVMQKKVAPPKNYDIIIM
jgi:hypothetical protein